MSLRKKMLERSRVAGCTYQQTQQRNSPEFSATTIATTPQRPASNSYEISVSSATSTATASQLVSCGIFPQQFPKAALIVPSCAAVATVMAPIADLWPKLEAIAKKFCDHWLDSQKQSTEMLTSLRGRNPQWQQYWIDHLEASHGKPK
jgi:hypothetical protein